MVLRAVLHLNALFPMVGKSSNGWKKKFPMVGKSSNGWKKTFQRLEKTRKKLPTIGNYFRSVLDQ